MENKNTEIPADSGEPDAQNSPKMNEGDMKELKQKKVSKTKDTGKKKTKHGVVYLSCIPQSMSVKRLREEMDKYGETGNIFLQPDGNHFLKFFSVTLNWNFGYVLSLVFCLPTVFRSGVFH